MTFSDKLNFAIAIAAGLSAVVAAVYTFVTAKILRANRDAVAAMRSQVHELSRPRVMIWPWVRMGTTMFCLTVRNGGSSSAEQLRLTVDRDFYVFGEKREDRNLRKFSAFSNEIQALAPGAEMVFYLGVSYQMFAAESESTPLTFTIHAGYSSSGVKYDERTVVDLKAFHESAVPQDPIADEIGKVAKELKSIHSELSSLRQQLKSSNKSLQPIAPKDGAPVER